MGAKSFYTPTTSMLIQVISRDELESMMSRLLDKKLAPSQNSTPTVERFPENKLYRRKEAAEKLNISPTLLEKWTKQGLIKSRKIGTRIYYVEKDINEAIKNAFNSSKS